MDAVLTGFLERQDEEATALAEASDRLELVPIDGPPPQRDIASFRARGLALGPDGQVREADRCDMAIWLPDDYLRHVEPAQVLTYLGPEPSPWHPNIRPPFICLHVRPGTPLVEILYSCTRHGPGTCMARATRGSTTRPRSGPATRPPAGSPFDRRPLKRRELHLGIQTVIPEARP